MQGKSHAIFENQRALNYDQFVNDWIPNYQFFLNLIPTLLQEYLSTELLVVGSGTGNEIIALLKCSADSKVTGVDPSPQMVKQAKEQLKDYPNVTLIEGQVSKLSNGMQFGAATLNLVLHFLPDDGSKLSLLRDIGDRLQPGAPLLLLDITGNLKQIRDNLQILKTIISREIPADEVTERLDRIEGELHHISEQRLMELLKLAGFVTPIRFFQTSILYGLDGVEEKEPLISGQ